METPPKIGFVSLGCPKALVDSERILTRLRCEGYSVAPTYEQADLVVINTCGFINAARDESMEAIGEALEENGRVVVTGCLGTESERVRERFPELLGVTGPQDFATVLDVVHQHAPPPHDPFTSLVPPQGIKLTPGHYAYLKISEGCNHHCSFCIIPSLRGSLVSRPVGDVLREAETLVASGVRELLVISQDTSAYGVDLRYRTGFWGGTPVRTRLPELVDSLTRLGVWVRLHYVYPYPQVDELIPLMSEGRLLPYLDIPFQHASDRVLKAMKRPAASAKVLDRIAAWRAQCPNLTLRSTFIVGFPGETEQDFLRLLEFLEQAQLDRVGCFQYSPVDGATANALPNPVAEEIKAERYHRFMETQTRISAQHLQRKVGQTLEVLIDRVDEQVCVGRSQGDAPEIDGTVVLPPSSDIQPGDFVRVRIVSAAAHDLYAVPA